MKNRILSFGIVLLLHPACVYVTTTEIPVHPAIREHSAQRRPKLFLEEGVLWDKLPFLIPYETMVFTHDKSTGRGAIALQAWQKGAEGKADVVRVLRPEQRPPNLETTAVFYRLAPCSPGFLADSTGLVTDAGAARARGLLEGDKVLTLAGFPFELWPGPRSVMVYDRLWSSWPGLTLPLTWIRPGAGNMTANIECQPNPPTHLEIPDSFAWKEPVRYFRGPARRSP